MDWVKRMRILLPALVLALALSACGEETPAQAEIFAMDTVMTLTAYGKDGEQAVDETRQEIQRLDRLLDRTESSSERGSAAVSSEVFSLIQSAVTYGSATGHAFDITVAPVVSAWGFTTDHYQVPDQATLSTLLRHVDSDQLTLLAGEDGGTVALGQGQSIDLGGIAKGYTSDRAEAIFRAAGVESGSISLGGNVYVQGSKPDGSLWRVAVQDPQNSSAAAVVLELSDAYAVTSGGYQRYFDQDGKRYHHIIDPATGFPADSGLLSVTVVAPANGDTDGTQPGNGTMCDAFSTALFVMGEEKALDFWRSGDYAFDLVLVTGDGRVVVTEGLADSFEQSEGSGYAYEIAH